jgi:hypothetical protein
VPLAMTYFISIRHVFSIFVSQPSEYSEEFKVLDGVNLAISFKEK